MNEEISSNKDKYPVAFRGWAYINGGMRKTEFRVVGIEELQEKINDLIQKKNAIEVHFGISH